MRANRRHQKLPRYDLDGNAITNRILCSISEEEFRKLQPSLEFVELHHHRLLHHPAEDVDAAYFINSGLASLIVTTERRKSVEVGVVGYEGLTGMPLAAGLRRSTAHIVVQIEGNGFRVKRTAFEKAVRDSQELRDRVLRYSIIHAMQVSQTAACNRLHDARQRLARWLLMTRDRISSDVVRMTHDFLAIMLGTDRPTVTITARALQQAGAIQYGRRFLTIVDRAQLERAACECYFAVRQFNPAMGL